MPLTKVASCSSKRCQAIMRGVVNSIRAAFVGSSFSRAVLQIRSASAARAQPGGRHLQRRITHSLTHPFLWKGRERRETNNRYPGRGRRREEGGNSPFRKPVFAQSDRPRGGGGGSSGKAGEAEGRGEEGRRGQGGGGGYQQGETSSDHLARLEGGREGEGAVM